jgi:hypothetical protein
MSDPGRLTSRDDKIFGPETHGLILRDALSLYGVERWLSETGA